jgi:hypothetical protein
MFKYLLTITLFFLVACTTQLPSEDSNPVTSTPIATDTPDDLSLVLSAELILTPTWIPTITMIAEPSLTPTPTATPIPAPVPTPGVILKAGCPALVDSSEPAIWPQGSILFNWGRIHDRFSAHYVWLEKPEIWTISATDLTPRLFLESVGAVRVSPDGFTLLSLDVSSTETREIVFHYLLSGDSVRVPVPADVYLPSLLPDGRAHITYLIEMNFGKGEVWERFIIDPSTGIVEQTIWELDLPNYEFFEYDAERGIPTGFVAIDPTYQRVLYTAGDGGLEHEVRLLDLETGEILWRISTPSLVDTPPEWSEDGRYVLFMVGEPIPGTRSAWSRIVSLTRDGVEEELPPQPFPQAEHYVANVSRSPDQRFIFYSLYSYETSRLHGYVVDTVTWEVGDVCDLNHTLFGSLPYDKVEADWLPEGQLVYRVLIEQDGQVAHSLRVLDIPSWTAQVVFEAEPGYGINVFGWTPIEEFP